MIVIDARSPKPLGEQVEAGLRAAIAAGDVAPGDRLPTVRQLAGDLGVSLNTVARAYRQLESDGLVDSVRGRGTVVSSRTQGNARTPASRDGIVAKLREVVADARLAGLTRVQFEKLAVRAAAELWK